MEFHDILHGLIKFSNKEFSHLLEDLINSPEIHRLRNMRQMNFDVPLIQELGRSRRLPHSIGVTYLAVEVAQKSGLDLKATKELLAAAILHDAAIPPYGHLVESELKLLESNFNHEKTLSKMIRGELSEENDYLEIVFGKQLQLANILRKHDVDKNSVLDLVCPKDGTTSAISAGVDLDNIDNVHRMAAMLGWSGAKSNLRKIISGMQINESKNLCFTQETLKGLEKWLDFRQRIYTLIIGHPECIPYNALQNDLVRLAVKNEIITTRDWYKTEPEFEEQLRNNKHTEKLARQLISGCEYQLIDYIWFKNFSSSHKKKNAEIVDFLHRSVPAPFKDASYFVWNEKGLISRRINVEIDGSNTITMGSDSISCMIAILKTTSGKIKTSKQSLNTWRKDVATAFSSHLGVSNYDASFPEDYTGSFYSSTEELKFEI